MSNDINIDSICQKIQDRCLLNNNEVKYMDSNGKIWAYEDKPTLFEWEEKENGFYWNNHLSIYEIDLILNTEKIKPELSLLEV